MNDVEVRAYTSELREKSRQEYLKKREQQMLDALEKEILDEQFLFADETLTSAEKKQLQLYMYINILFLKLEKWRCGNLPKLAKIHQLKKIDMLFQMVQMVLQKVRVNT